MEEICRTGVPSKINTIAISYNLRKRTMNMKMVLRQVSEIFLEKDKH